MPDFLIILHRGFEASLCPLTASEKGQALILIALAAIGLFAFSALAIDGSRVYSDRRPARGHDVTITAEAHTTSNGYDNGTQSDVTISMTNSPSGVCPANIIREDITVTIVSYVDTTFARIIGRTQVANAVTATSRMFFLSLMAAPSLQKRKDLSSSHSTFG